MDLTGRAPGYRGIAIRCPGCAEPMATEVVGDAEVDVCTACGGTWVDWFDGEVRRVASSVISGELARASRPAPAPTLRNESVATGACPRCMRQLAVERYVLHVAVGPKAAERTSVSTATGADLLRCEECAGVFVPRSSAALLAMLPPDEEAPPSSTEASAELEPLPWQRFVALVKRLVGVA